LEKLYKATNQNTTAARDMLDSFRNAAENARNMSQTALVDTKRADDELFSRERRRKKELDKLRNASIPTKKETKLKDILADLNQEFDKGRITVSEYYERLNEFDKLTIDRSFRDGKINLTQFNEQMEEFKRKEISREFARGGMSLTEFNRRIEENQVAELNAQLSAGLITLEQFDDKLVKISSHMNLWSQVRIALNDYVEKGAGIATVIKDVFEAMEDQILSLIKNGKVEWSAFAQSILDDLMKITIRAAILAPISRGIASLIPTPSTGSTADIGAVGPGGGHFEAMAKGAAFDNGIRRFAKGGLVNRPSLFSYNKGQTGLMGEAGTEAIVPLGRAANGDLGIQASVTPVTINVINQNGSDIERRETTGPNGERTIEMLIKNKVQQGIADGSFDKSMRQAYGVNRKGV
jgi:lambda family phage tail tape measure protein